MMGKDCYWRLFTFSTDLVNFDFTRFSQTSHPYCQVSLGELDEACGLLTLSCDGLDNLMVPLKRLEKDQKYLVVLQCAGDHRGVAKLGPPLLVEYPCELYH